MTEEEQALADEWYACIQAASNNSERSEQAKEFNAGISDIGYCSERLRRMINGEDPEDTDVLAAFIGTAIGDHAEQAYKARHPNAILQADVKVTLYGDQGSYTVPGHPDIVDPDEALVIDGKTAYGTELAARQGPTFQQLVQRNGYAKGAWEAGLFPKGTSLAALRVANVWIDRAAIDKFAHVDMTPFDPEVLAEAGRWLDNVLYAYAHDEEAMKEPPLEMCAVTCGFFEPCRGGSAPTGLLTDPLVLEALAMYEEGSSAAKAGARLKDQAKEQLKGVEGSNGRSTIRWIHVNESDVKPYTRKAYSRIDVRKVR